MKFKSVPISVFLALFGCSIGGHSQSIIHTVDKSISPEEMGLTLIHEHVLVDFIGADETGYHRWNKDSVVAQILPYLMEVKARGVKTIVECTPAFLGRDPILLQKLSEASGINFLTNTGYYGAVDGKYLPKTISTISDDQLADIWIREFENGIEDTNVKPAFIKISVNEGANLSEIDSKIVRAAARTHKATGLLIVSHTGSWETASAQINILEEESVDLSSFVWVHAQNETDMNKYKVAAKKGVWVSLDGVVWDVEGHLEKIIYMKNEGLLDNLLVSHDAGWYSPGEENGGDFKGFTSLFDDLIPKLKDRGFTEEELNQILVINPKRAFTRKVDF